MVHELKERIERCTFYLMCCVKSMKYRFTSNQFVKDLFLACERYGHKYDTFIVIVQKYESHLNSINQNLYMLLDEMRDRDTLIRFLLKEFYSINTATTEELKLIDSAFEEVKRLYRQRKEDYIEFKFREKDIKYLVRNKMREDESRPENVLMNYFDVAHAFFLTEYELEDFNPENGKTIFDCGAAFGDTLLMFRALYPDSPIFSFEYEEENIEFLKKNVLLNNIDNVVVRKAFLYRDSGKHLLNLDTYKIDDNLNSANVIEIQTLSLDDYVKGNSISDIGLIKFDIEGGEQAALEGTIKTIKEQKPLLYIPIYHLDSDIYIIPEFLQSLNMPMRFRIKWTEKKVWGVDCVLFVKFI